jgi:predicted amidohydrolase
MISRIAVVQAHPQLGRMSENLAEISRLAREAVNGGAQMVVFPELATTGYGFNSFNELQEALDGGTGLTEIGELSRQLGIVIVAGYAEIRDGVALNKAALFDNGDLRADYVKTHLWNTEKHLFQPGSELPSVVTTSIGKVALAVCYDLEFPELIRHCAINGADIVAAPTNWPSGFEAPSHVGPFNGELLRAMAGASTNRIYVAVACRTGEERGVAWVDNSCVIDPDGYPITELFDGVGIAYADIDTAESHNKLISPLNNVVTDRRIDLY